MNICVFDTETTSLEKPFVYNIGYVIYDTANHRILKKRDYVVEQVWHNPMLFTTAYYADKRPLYVRAMRARITKMDKFGYITQKMYHDFKNFNVAKAFAYNSSFDEKVFAFNCDWFKCINPFDNIPITDIRGFVHTFLVNDNYKKFCEQNSFFTPSGNYSTTAEVVYRYITNNINFIEDHTALSDSEIELDILLFTLETGADIMQDYKTKISIPRIQKKVLQVLFQKRKVLDIEYTKMRINKERTKINLE